MAEKDYKQEAEVLADLAIDLMVQEASKYFNATDNEIKAVAARFTGYVDECVAMTAARDKIMAQAEEGSPSAVLAFSKAMIDTEEKFLKLTEYLIDLQEAVNDFLGQRVIMTFVDIGSEGNVEMYKVDNSVEDIKLDKGGTKRGGHFSGRYNKSNFKTLQKITHSKYNKQSLDSTFAHVYERFLVSKSKLPLGGGSAYILWKKSTGRWDGVWISGAGILGETYVNFFINEYLFSGMVEECVQDYMTNEKYGAVTGDSASGFLQGDVSKRGFEFGVKTEGGTVLGYSKIIDYARELQEAANVREYLLALKQKLKEEGRRNLAIPVAQKLKKEEMSILDPIKKEMKNVVERCKDIKITP